MFQVSLDYIARLCLKISNPAKNERERERERRER
jgi:hypothetical protein